MKIEEGYDKLFKQMKEDGFYGQVSFKLIGGEVKLIKFESTFKSVEDAISGKTNQE